MPKTVISLLFVVFGIFLMVEAAFAQSLIDFPINPSASALCQDTRIKSLTYQSSSGAYLVEVDSPLTAQPEVGIKLDQVYFSATPKQTQTTASQGGFAQFFSCLTTSGFGPAVFSCSPLGGDTLKPAIEQSPTTVITLGNPTLYDSKFFFSVKGQLAGTPSSTSCSQTPQIQEFELTGHLGGPKIILAPTGTTIMTPEEIQQEQEKQARKAQALTPVQQPIPQQGQVAPNPCPADVYDLSKAYTRAGGCSETTHCILEKKPIAAAAVHFEFTCVPPKPGVFELARAHGLPCNPDSDPPGKPDKNGSGFLTAIGCIPTQPIAFVKGTLKFVSLLAGGIALLLMIFGAFRMIISSGNADELTAGQEQFKSALIGLLFIIFSVLLLEIIGVDILGIPGITKS